MTPEDIERTFKKTWEEVEKLKKKGEIWFFNINGFGDYKEKIKSKQVNKTTFAFDYAVVCSEEEAKKIEKLIEDYRKSPLVNTEMIKRLERVMNEIKKYPHVFGYWL